MAWKHLCYLCVQLRCYSVCLYNFDSLCTCASFSPPAPRFSSRFLMRSTHLARGHPTPRISVTPDAGGLYARGAKSSGLALFFKGLRQRKFSGSVEQRLGLTRQLDTESPAQTDGVVALRGGMATEQLARRYRSQSTSTLARDPPAIHKQPTSDLSL